MDGMASRLVRRAERAPNLGASLTLAAPPGLPAGDPKAAAPARRWGSVRSGGLRFVLRQQCEALLQLQRSRQQQAVPAAAKRLDQADAGKEQVLTNGQLGFLVGEQLHFRDDDRRERHCAGPKLIQKYIHRFALIGHGAALLGELLR